MNRELDIDKIIKQGEIRNELELERVSVAERRLRVLAKEGVGEQSRRSKLRKLIQDYERKYWSNPATITDSQIEESDQAEMIVLDEIKFINIRKRLIRTKLKKLGLKQQEFGKILGHSSKSYISELMNGISPFTMRDLILISKLLKIDLKKLIPTEISEEERLRIERNIKMLGKSEIRLNQEEFSIK